MKDYETTFSRPIVSIFLPREMLRPCPACASPCSETFSPTPVLNFGTSSPFTPTLPDVCIRCGGSGWVGR